ncbi:hypothetical protein Ciccas_010022 [Cichlidogyrus casuarinus]|uniref:Uncharacterized protein n=1 Tax=Cichlidogyrus casuarinus TaxID=1844966 RepID=A0ABD2PX85_9PLAT
MRRITETARAICLGDGQVLERGEANKEARQLMQLQTQTGAHIQRQTKAANSSGVPEGEKRKVDYSALLTCALSKPRRSAIYAQGCGLRCFLGLN